MKLLSSWHLGILTAIVLLSTSIVSAAGRYQRYKPGQLGQPVPPAAQPIPVAQPQQQPTPQPSAPQPAPIQQPQPQPQEQPQGPQYPPAPQYPATPPQVPMAPPLTRPITGAQPQAPVPSVPAETYKEALDIQKAIKALPQGCPSDTDKKKRGILKHRIANLKKFAGIDALTNTELDPDQLSEALRKRCASGARAQAPGQPGRQAPQYPPAPPVAPSYPPSSSSSSSSVYSTAYPTPPSSSSSSSSAYSSRQSSMQQPSRPPARQLNRQEVIDKIKNIFDATYNTATQEVDKKALIEGIEALKTKAADDAQLVIERTLMVIRYIQMGDYDSASMVAGSDPLYLLQSFFKRLVLPQYQARFG